MRDLRGTARAGRSRTRACGRDTGVAVRSDITREYRPSEGPGPLAERSGCARGFQEGREKYWRDRLWNGPGVTGRPSAAHPVAPGVRAPAAAPIHGRMIAFTLTNSFMPKPPCFRARSRNSSHPERHVRIVGPEGLMRTIPCRTGRAPARTHGPCPCRRMPPPQPVYGCPLARRMPSSSFLALDDRRDRTKISSSYGRHAGGDVGQHSGKEKRPPAGGRRTTAQDVAPSATLPFTCDFTLSNGLAGERVRAGCPRSVGSPT